MKPTSANYSLIDRSIGIVFIEHIACAAVLSIVTVAHFGWPWAMHIAVFIVDLFVLDVLFYKVFIWRWIFSLVMSAAWGITAILIAKSAIGLNANTYIIGTIVFLFILWLHYDDFDFGSTTTTVDYEKFDE